MPLCKGNVVLLCFLYQTVYKGQTITTLEEKGRKGFRALCAMVLETAEQAKVIFSTLVSYESQKSEVDQSES